MRRSGDRQFGVRTYFPRDEALWGKEFKARENLFDLSMISKAFHFSMAGE
jgi:hypothetical protein